MKHIDVMILGAGVAGLGAALRSRENQLNYAVFEATKIAGGLLDSFVINGFSFDNAVHLSFANEPIVRKVFDKTEYITHPSDSYNYDGGYWLKHPVQNNIFPLPAEQKLKLVKSFVERPELDNIENYKQWLIHQYGYEISERYPLRYTRKYWQCDADALSTSWIGNRMRRAELSEILYGSYTSDTPNTYYTKEMRYPVNGGFKSFISPLINETNILFNYKAVAIDLLKKMVTFENGEVWTYGNLVSSIPLPIFISICGDTVPQQVVSAASLLEATSIDLISVAFNKKIAKDLWFYIYDEDIYASRVYSPSVKSPQNAPTECSSMQFEFYNPGRESQYSELELKNNVIYALKKMKIADESDVIFMHHKHLLWGNITFKVGMESHRQIVREFISANNVKSVGRFGEWDYLWSNQSFMSGYDFIE